VKHGVRWIHPAPASATTAALLGGALWLAAVGCTEQRVVRSGWDSLDPDAARARAVEQSGGSIGAIDEADIAHSSVWAIALGQVEGPTHRADAARRRAQIAAASGMPEVWIVDEGDRSVIYHGRYDSPQNDRAQADLKRWQQLLAQRAAPVDLAALVPVQAGVDAGAGGHDLRLARERGVYTLQIGFFENRDANVQRSGAETWVRKLRQEGIEAYYYHGPNRSVVTVGVFDEQAIEVNEGRVEIVDPRLRELQRRFPHNLANGSVIVMRGESAGGRVTEENQPSFLVRIPGSTLAERPAPVRRSGDRRVDDPFTRRPAPRGPNDPVDGGFLP